MALLDPVNPAIAVAHGLAAERAKHLVVIHVADGADYGHVVGHSGLGDDQADRSSSTVNDEHVARRHVDRAIGTKRRLTSGRQGRWLIEAELVGDRNRFRNDRSRIQRCSGSADPYPAVGPTGDRWPAVRCGSHYRISDGLRDGCDESVRHPTRRERDAGRGEFGLSRCSDATSNAVGRSDSPRTMTG